MLPITKVSEMQDVSLTNWSVFNFHNSVDNSVSGRIGTHRK